jgi:hypothetical protein
MAPAASTHAHAKLKRTAQRSASLPSASGRCSAARYSVAAAAKCCAASVREPGAQGQASLLTCRRALPCPTSSHVSEVALRQARTEDRSESHSKPQIDPRTWHCRAQGNKYNNSNETGGCVPLQTTKACAPKRATQARTSRTRGSQLAQRDVRLGGAHARVRAAGVQAHSARIAGCQGVRVQRARLRQQALSRACAAKPLKPATAALLFNQVISLWYNCDPHLSNA